MRLSVVGLGPGPAEWVAPAALARLRAPGARVFVRTALHPAVPRVLDGLEYTSFDALYEHSPTLAEVHAQIVDQVLAGGGEDHHQEVVLAVPGDGLLGESVLEQLQAAGVQLSVVPGVPLGIGALAAAGLPATEGAQVVEVSALGGQGIDLQVELNPRWSAVVVGVYSRGIASELKLALQRVYPAEHEVVVVHHPGLDDQQIRRVPLAELDRGRLPLDHLTHVVLPAGPAYVPTGSTHVLRSIVARLRAPEIGCPWDLQQTHATLTRYMIEEAYEAVDAIEQQLGPAALADELGDVLLQVALHAEIADQADEFDWNDVVRGLGAKLVRRHPHVFGDVEVSGAADVVRNWDLLKAQERDGEPPPDSVLDGVPRSLPALKRASELARKASRAGFDWPTRDGTLDKVREELAELLAATSLAERQEEIGDLLYILAKLACQEGVDPEEALRAANAKFTTRFQALEQIARERGWSSLKDTPLPDLEAAWSEAKRRTR
jgi:tetrapyrrole methylase family protein / MazG family protein